MISVASALMSGVRPSFTFEKISIGSVLPPGPDTKLAITRSSSDSVKASNQPATIAGAMVLAAQRIGDNAVPPLVLFGGAAGFSIVGLSLWVWFKFDENVARPIERLARDMRAITHGGASGKIDHGSARYLGSLAPAAKDVIEALSESRSEVDQAIRDATKEVEQQKGRLEAVLRDLQEAVLICTLDHKILLYNRRALEILHISGDLGLGRSLIDVISAQPLRHALDRLTVRFEEARHHDHD